MLGLNRNKTLYTYTAYYYEFIGLKGNIQQFKSTPKKFKCSYSTSAAVTPIIQNQGMPTNNLTIETDSSIDFKINDKVVINGVTMLVKDQVIENNPFSGKYTNRPRAFIKYITLQ